ncbi:MAG: RidA family protein [Mariprofundaceae bacterium]
MSNNEFIHSDAAPKAVGPYSQAVVHGGLLFASGQIGLDPVSGKLVASDVITQAGQVMKNLQAVLTAAACGLNDILKVSIYLTDMGDFSRVNSLYAEWLGDHRPARATVAVAALPLGAKIEMDVIASAE